MRRVNQFSFFRSLYVFSQFIPLSLEVLFALLIHIIEVSERGYDAETKKNEEHPWTCSELFVQPIPYSDTDCDGQGHGQTNGAQKIEAPEKSL